MIVKMRYTARLDALLWVLPYVRHGRVRVCFWWPRVLTFSPTPLLVLSRGLQKGWVEKLVQRVVDNIEINVADIHIRYM